MVNPRRFRTLRRALVARGLAALVAVALLAATPNMHAAPGNHLHHAMTAPAMVDADAGLHAVEKTSPMAQAEADCVGAHCAACAAVSAAAGGGGSPHVNRPALARNGTDPSRVAEPHYRPPRFPVPSA